MIPFLFVYFVKKMCAEAYITKQLTVVISGCGIIRAVYFLPQISVCLDCFTYYFGSKKHNKKNLR